METVADFKRELIPGSVWECVNNLHPQVSGRRVILKGKSVFSYSYETADGKSGENGRMELPKSSEVRIGGNTVAWVDSEGGVRYSWTKIS